jgi:4-amino-4-deoxy-L-arabinose transferase-like glycosyltransferase
MSIQEHASTAIPDRPFALVVALGIVLNTIGLLSPIMEPDGALYATIARTMAESGDFVNLMRDGRDWLDKPHFPFWMAAISFRMLGINAFAYKLPALLFFCTSLAYTYHFARLAYGRVVAQIATLIMLTSLQLVISNNDVRAEPYLTAQIIGAVFHYFRLYQRNRWYDLVIGALWSGLALMTKGPFVLIPIAAGLAVHFAIRGEWREFLRLRWYAAACLSVLFCLPELWSLYLQFDLHPDKVVFGTTGNSGLRFFLWDSQFGRFFNTGPIKGAGDKTFFLHTTLWAFAPWSILLYAAIGRATGQLVRRVPDLAEYVSLGSGVTTFLLFSLSGFQLPYYLNIVFPFYAVLTAHYLSTIASPKPRHRWLLTQQAQFGLFSLAVGGFIWLFHPEPFGGAVAFCVVTIVGTVVLARGRWLTTLLGYTLGAAVLSLGVYNLFLYPNLVPYQAGGEAAFFINTHNIRHRPAGQYGVESSAFRFYLKQEANAWGTRAELAAAARQEPVWVLSTPLALDTLQREGWAVERLHRFANFRITKPTLRFLDRKTRADASAPYVLAEVRSGE